MLLPNALAVGSYEAKRANIIEIDATASDVENWPRVEDGVVVFDTKVAIHVGSIRRTSGYEQDGCSA